ncbi:MAG: serine hydrolase, partial [Phycisphaerae bacterium]|nr:serine hydrolase [Phycisphaerae bacterium]
YLRPSVTKPWTRDGSIARWVSSLNGRLAPIYPAGGLVSTARDMAVFMQMFLNDGAYGGKRFLEPETVELMTRNHTPRDESGWGLGWSKYYQDHAPIGSSPRHYNHAGMFGTYGFVDPAFDLVVVFLQQLDLRGHVAEDSFRLARSAVKIDPDKAPDYGLPLVYQTDFQDGKTDRWEPTDPKAWRILDVDGRKVFDQYQRSKYKPKHHSPFNIAWLKDAELGDFVIDYRLRSTTKTYGHRDMCLFFGRKDAEHFYYVHMGFKADANSNSIMIVNGKPRISIIQDKMANPGNAYDWTDAVTRWRAPGTNWTDEWHRVRLIRRADAGTIEVYFNDFSTPHMYAIDKTFPVGRIGIGSFDDTGYWDEVKIWGNVRP